MIPPPLPDPTSRTDGVPRLSARGLGPTGRHGLRATEALESSPTPWTLPLATFASWHARCQHSSGRLCRRKLHTCGVARLVPSSTQTNRAIPVGRKGGGGWKTLCTVPLGARDDDDENKDLTTPTTSPLIHDGYRAHVSLTNSTSCSWPEQQSQREHDNTHTQLLAWLAVDKIALAISWARDRCRTVTQPSRESDLARANPSTNATRWSV